MVRLMLEMTKFEGVYLGKVTGLPQVNGGLRQLR